MNDMELRIKLVEAILEYGMLCYDQGKTPLGNNEEWERRSALCNEKWMDISELLAKV